MFHATIISHDGVPAEPRKHAQPAVSHGLFCYGAWSRPHDRPGHGLRDAVRQNPRRGGSSCISPSPSPPKIARTVAQLPPSSPFGPMSPSGARHAGIVHLAHDGDERPTVQPEALRCNLQTVAVRRDVRALRDNGLGRGGKGCRRSGNYDKACA